MVDDNRAEGEAEPDAQGPEATAPGEGESIGLRRSTFTPPPTGAAADVTMSDDDLADALFQDFEKATHSGTIHVIPDAPTSGAEEQGPFDDALEGTSDSEPPPPPVDEAAGSETPPVSLDETAGPETPPVPPDEVANPEPLVRPVRRSLPVDDLASVIEGEAPSTLDALERLEEQLRLREEDARDFAEWQETMLASGSPEAVAEVESARSEFHDILERPGQTATPAAAQPSPTHTFRRS